MTAKSFTFYLGTHQPHWLSQARFPLFISHRRLREYKTLPIARAPWSLDSGGFSALDKNGEWDMTEKEYITAVRRYRDEIGMLQWAAPMDWMCEQKIREKTGKTVKEHIQLTVRNLISLQYKASDLRFIPVLQGFELDDYIYCADVYDQAGVYLDQEPVVGLGSVCRRQGTEEIGLIVKTFAAQGISLHGFGVKAAGLAKYGAHLTSSDSMAWSYAARRQPPMAGCRTHINCANCLPYARLWRARLLAQLTY